MWPVTTSQNSRLERWLVVVGIVVLGFNLRPAAVSVGPVLDELTTDLAMSPTTAGVLTSLPVLAFAIFGASAPAFGKRWGMHSTTLVALLAVVLGLATRARLDSAPLFLLASLVALGGMATANVLLPSLVKLHFPQRVGLMTSVYTTSLALGLTFSSVLTVPISQGLGSWRWGLGTWALTAGLAALPWLGLLRHDSALKERPRAIGLREVARTRLGWAMALTFGLQSTQAYTIFGWAPQVFRDAGFSATTAGVLLGVVTGIGIPLSFVVPALAGRLPDHTWLMLGLVACYPLGYGGLILAPSQGAWLWAALLGVGTAVFPLVLAQIGLRARTPEGTASLSGFTQSVGYLIAAPGPFAVGVLYEVTGGWTWPLLAMTFLSLVLALVARTVARPAYVEDQLP